MTPPMLHAVLGPTASGKSALAMALAEHVGGEIVSCDSAQIFVGLDLGTAKPTPAEQARVRHHLIDVLPPTEQWSAAQYAAAADQAIAEIQSRGRIPILCGGTGLWQRALVFGIFSAPAIDPKLRAAVRQALVEHGPQVLHDELRRVDPEAAAKIQPGDPQRIGRALEVYRQTGVPISRLQAEHGFREARYRLLAVTPQVPKEELHQRIKARTQHMYAAGLVEEVRALLARGIPASAPGLSIIGYRDAAQVVAGTMTLEEAIERTETSTRQYAKRQRNWWRNDSALWPVDPQATAAELWERLREREAAL
ncbi:MAG: tRNA (adenosine(37)-N6)-dimethylallyltransferase MiaA [Deltaproteobacteria bacterium]|nr:tRNA (adenosine(37)-N6)-dimethylallyltransferase MiaA [Deltaproteobacteria bacterium]